MNTGKITWSVTSLKPSEFTPSSWWAITVPIQAKDQQGCKWGCSQSHKKSLGYAQVRLGRKGFFWGVGYSQISLFAHHQGLLHCACHLILSKESTPWRPQVRLRLIRLGLSMRWPLPLKLWREWNGYYNEEAIGLPLSRRSIRFGETNFNLLSSPLLVIFSTSYQEGGT